MNKYSSIFSQLLPLFPRLEFERLVRQTGAEFAAKGFSNSELIFVPGTSVVFQDALLRGQRARPRTSSLHSRKTPPDAGRDRPF
jgi:hypothetical protein